MLKIKRATWWGRDYLLCGDSEQIVARMGVNRGWGVSDRIEIGGRVLAIHRSGWRGPWQVSSNGHALATIRKVGAFSRSLEMVYEQIAYGLDADFWSPSLTMSTGTRLLGTVKRAGFFSQESLVDLMDDVPLELQAIASWAALLIWRRAQLAGAMAVIAVVVIEAS